MFAPSTKIMDENYEVREDYEDGNERVKVFDSKIKDDEDVDVLKSPGFNIKSELFQ